MRRIPSFALLRAFEAAARAESFAIAATELGVTPSAVSHQVKGLEEYLGRTLFFRRHRRVELTPQGRALAERLNGVFDVLEAACDDFAVRPDAGLLTVHSAPSFASKWLGPRLKRFTEANPGITIRITSGPEPADLIADRGIDAAISYGHAVRRDGLSVYPLGVEEFAPMCAPSLRAGYPSVRALLEQAPLIYSPLSRVTWDQWFESQQLQSPPGRRLSFDRASLGIAAAVDGMGVVLETKRLAEPELADGALVDVGEGAFSPVSAETHFLSIRASERRITRTRAFVDWLLTLAALPMPTE